MDPFQPAVAPVPEVATYAPAGSPRTSIRQVFAGTLAAAASVTGATLIMGLTQAITGGLTNWFSRRTGTPPATTPLQPTGAPVPVYSPPALPNDAAAVPPAYPAPAYSPPPEPAVQAPPAAGGAYTGGAPYFDPATGASTGGDAAFAAAGGDAALYAGIAYEVHAVGAGGTAVPVDPATHEFRTGERFVVHYRPALPGRMEVYNINPAGRETLIDDVELAAGQLATLGPYEFASLKGDERLRLVLTPCTRPELVLATRDIVKVSPSTGSGQALGMATCGPVTRSIPGPRTRDIRKVALDGATAFALDPVSAEERTTGRFAPREVTIVFQHR